MSVNKIATFSVVIATDPQQARRYRKPPPARPHLLFTVLRPERYESAERSASRRSGTTFHIIQRPRFSPTSSPASASALVWWLIVGCDLPSGTSRSHEHTSP